MSLAKVIVIVVSIISAIGCCEDEGRERREHASRINKLRTFDGGLLPGIEDPTDRDVYLRSMFHLAADEAITVTYDDDGVVLVTITKNGSPWLKLTRDWVLEWDDGAWRNVTPRLFTPFGPEPDG